MVLIKDENHPPFKWPLGRIINVIKGNDGLARVVDVRTATNVLRKPIHKLAPLPVQTEKVPSVTVVERPESPNQETHTDPPAKKRSKSSIGLNVVSLLLTVLLIPSVQCTSEVPAISIAQFNTNPGIYYENLGPAGIIKSQWELVAYIDLHAYWRSVKFSQNYPPLLRNLCNETREDSCNSILNMIERLTSEIVQNHQMIEFHNKQRMKRGALNVVGNVANALFGVLDSEYAENMAAIIKEVQQNDDNMKQQLSKQTSFLDATVNLMKENYGEIEAEFINIQNVLRATNDKLSIMENQVHANYVNQVINDIGLQASFTISYLERVQDSLLDILMDTHHGKISAELLSPGQLHNELIRIKGNLPTSMKIPVNPNDIVKFYQLMNIKGRIVDRIAIFRITLPLLLNEEFELLRLHPIPWIGSKTNKINILQITIPYVMVNLHRDQFYPLSEADVKGCLTVEEEIHLCHAIHPKYPTTATIAACEMTLLTQKIYHPQCKFLSYESGSYWKQLHDPNKWIFSVDHEVTLNAVCDTEILRLECKGAGLLTLNDNCVVKEPSITIQGRRTSQVSAHIPYVPEINISQAIGPSTKNSTIQYHNQYQVHQIEFKNLKEELASMTVEKTTTFSVHDVHHYVTIWICILLLMIMAVILMYRYQTGHERDDAVELRTVWNTTQPPTTSN